jgi:plastocyanin
VHRGSSSLPVVLLSFATAAATLACGDDDVLGAAGTAGQAGHGAGHGGGGEGQGGGGQAGSGGAPLGCGDAITFEAIHGCDPAMLTDLTAEDAVTIGYGYIDSAFIYDPKCIHVCAGTEITFDALDDGNFQIHPLQGGVNPTPDPASPIPTKSDAASTSVTFTITEPGSYGYYCVAHASVGMAGAIYVQ